MKKLICTLLALAMCASMAACSDGEPAQSTDRTTDQKVDSTKATTPTHSTTIETSTTPASLTTTATPTTVPVTTVATPTTVPATTETPVTTTVPVTTVPVTTVPVTTAASVTAPDPNVPETPMTGNSLKSWTHDRTLLNGAIQGDSLHAKVASMPNSVPYPNLFGENEVGKGFMGAYIGMGAAFYWSMPDPVKLDSYVIYTCAENQAYPGRSPISWYLLGTNDYTLPSDIDSKLISETAANNYQALINDGWKLLDHVRNSGIADVADKPFGYKIDADKQGKYRHYCWLVTYSESTYITVGELELYTSEAHTHKFAAATCKKPKTCTVCRTTEGEALGHKFSEASCALPATCTVCGVTEGEALGHKFSEASCTLPATCTVCGVTEGEALGHKFSQASCASPATCTVCGVTEGEALGHKFSEASCALPATCTVCGVTEGEALGHKFSEASCASPATCTVCGVTEGEALGHKFSQASCTLPATCTVCGVTEGKALGHSYSEGVCTLCGEAEALSADTISDAEME